MNWQWTKKCDVGNDVGDDVNIDVGNDTGNDIGNVIIDNSENWNCKKNWFWRK